MKIVNGERVEIISHDDYWKRFPTKDFCEMCPFIGKKICDCGDNLYVKVSSDIIWR